MLKAHELKKLECLIGSEEAILIVQSRIKYSNRVSIGIVKNVVDQINNSSLLFVLLDIRFRTVLKVH